MASHCRTISRPAINLLKSTITKPSSRPSFPVQATRTSSSTFSRPLRQMSALQSLLPLHSAVSSARLTSCLGIDTKGCRSLSQVARLRENPYTMSIEEDRKNGRTLAYIEKEYAATSLPPD